MLRVSKTTPAEQGGGIAEQARAHCVALAGDAIRSGARSADVRGHQREIDHSLRGARGFVSLVHAHRPPKRNGPAAGNGSHKSRESLARQTCRSANHFPGERIEETDEILKPDGVRVNELQLHATAPDQGTCRAIEQHKIRFGSDWEVLRGVHRRLGFPRIDDDDFRPIGIPEHPLPKNRMGDAEVRSNKDRHVRFFEVRVSIGRRIEAEALLIGHVRGGHALPRVGIAVQPAHTEFEKRAEQSHLFRAYLAAAQERD